jgi:hypothetical protein
MPKDNITTRAIRGKPINRGSIWVKCPFCKDEHRHIFNVITDSDQRMSSRMADCFIGEYLIDITFLKNVRNENLR